MNVTSLLKSLATRATQLEEEARLLRADALQIQTLLFGDGDAAEPAPTPEDTVTPKQAAPKMPNREEIRAKAAQYGVDVDDLLPLGKKPTLQAKQDAMKRILKAKKDAEGSAASKGNGVDLSSVD